MAFNKDKCKVIHVGKNNLKHRYHINGSVLETATHEKDVGVIVHETLKPSLQCTEAAKKANYVLGQISRAFQYRDREVFIKLYKTYVRPHLEYSVAAWSPWTKEDKEILETVQMRAVRMVSGLQGRTYQERLIELGLDSLERRRGRNDMICTYKILHGIDDVDYKYWFSKTSSIHNRTTRLTADSLSLATRTSQSEQRRKFFSNRVI